MSGSVLYPSCHHHGEYQAERDPSGSLNFRCSVCGAWASYTRQVEIESRIESLINQYLEIHSEDDLVLLLASIKARRIGA